MQNENLFFCNCMWKKRLRELFQCLLGHILLYILMQRWRNMQFCAEPSKSSVIWVFAVWNPPPPPFCSLGMGWKHGNVVVHSSLEGRGWGWCHPTHPDLNTHTEKKTRKKKTILLAECTYISYWSSCSNIEAVSNNQIIANWHILVHLLWRLR